MSGAVSCELLAGLGCDGDVDVDANVGAEGGLVVVVVARGMDEISRVVLKPRRDLGMGMDGREEEGVWSMVEESQLSPMGRGDGWDCGRWDWREWSSQAVRVLWSMGQAGEGLFDSDDIVWIIVLLGMVRERWIELEPRAGRQKSLLLRLLQHRRHVHQSAAPARVRQGIR